MNAVDQRANPRYPLRLFVTYETRQGRRGAGTTVDVSSRGVRLELDHALPVGTRLRVDIAWPARLFPSVALRLRVEGKVIRSDYFHTAVWFRRHSFMTAGKPGTAAGKHLPAARYASGPMHSGNGL
jgi:hypothetical protein